MPFKTKEEKVQYDKARYMQLKEKIKIATRLWSLANKEKVRESKRKWENKAEGEHARKLIVKRKYGLNPKEYINLINNQGNLCAICFQEEPKQKIKTNRRRSLSVDHCHSTGKVRGLLCSKCNLGIGSFEDDLNRLHNAILYLNPKLKDVTTDSIEFSYGY